MRIMSIVECGMWLTPKRLGVYKVLKDLKVLKVPALPKSSPTFNIQHSTFNIAKSVLRPGPQDRFGYVVYFAYFCGRIHM